MPETFCAQLFPMIISNTASYPIADCTTFVRLFCTQISGNGSTSTSAVAQNEGSIAVSLGGGAGRTQTSLFPWSPTVNTVFACPVKNKRTEPPAGIVGMFVLQLQISVPLYPTIGWYCEVLEPANCAIMFVAWFGFAGLRIMDMIFAGNVSRIQYPEAAVQPLFVIIISNQT